MNPERLVSLRSSSSDLLASSWSSAEGRPRRSSALNRFHFHFTPELISVFGRIHDPLLPNEQENQSGGDVSWLCSRRSAEVREERAGPYVHARPHAHGRGRAELWAAGREVGRGQISPPGSPCGGERTRRTSRRHLLLWWIRVQASSPGRTEPTALSHASQGAFIRPFTWTRERWFSSTSLCDRKKISYHLKWIWSQKVKKKHFCDKLETKTFLIRLLRENLDSQF